MLNLKPNTPYRVTSGNDTLDPGDIIWISGKDGSLVLCPHKSDYEYEQGGWFSKEDLENWPDILEAEAAECSDEYTIVVSGRSETLAKCQS